MSFSTDDFFFDLPPERIAQQPIDGERDKSRLMVLDRANETTAHRQFFDLPELLRPDDILVLNDSKVFPARLIGRKPTGGAVEVLLLRPRSDSDSDGGGDVWEVLTRGRGLKPGTPIELQGDVRCRLIEKNGEHTWLVQFNKSGNELQQCIDQHGQTPIPPYIKNSPLQETELRSQYQNVYARHRGSAAAPTAGLHFTEQLLEKVQAKGVTIETITLHVGLGTFAPVKSKRIQEHRMHSELGIVSRKTAQILNEARQANRRIIAVGTTTVRTLESFSREGKIKSGEQWTDIFITPGYEFAAIDGMITNFHTPRSTLLMLVAAFAGYEFTMAAYREAVEKEYRFYSFGDAMLII